MDPNKLIDYLENSFLSSLLKKESITDISYNGKSIFYLDNLLGRRISDIKVDFITVKDFIRQLANLAEKQFSFQNPLLDISFGKYRINAVHQSVARRENLEAMGFSIRIASKTPKISVSSGFLSKVVEDLFNVLIKSHLSIVIGGITGSGKTEFQKYLLTLMEDNARVIVIDNVLELDSLTIGTNLDFNIWQADEKGVSSIQALVKNALRSNPDWLIVAEARGEEMIDVLNSSLTGHPIITTIHALNVTSMPSRMARMVMMNEKKMDYDDVLTDLSYHMRFYVYLKRRIDKEGLVRRFISSIAYFDEKEKVEIYSSDGTSVTFSKLPQSALALLNFDYATEEFRKIFIDGEEKK